MSRCRSAFVGLAACLVFAACAWSQERPNIVWLVSEDNSKHWLDLYDASGAPTPAIRKLAEAGLVYDHAFSNSPVCSVARTTLITGCYAPRIGTQFHRRSKRVSLPDGLRMFPAYLRDAGYYTTNNRKKDYNAVEGEGVWDASSKKASWRGRADGQSFFHMQSFGASHEGALHLSVKAMRNERAALGDEATDPAEVVLAPYHPDTPTFRLTYARYLDRIRRIDAQIGKVVEQLAADGLLDNTFVFYFGDHGGVLPRGKGYAYESGLHVPLVVRIPERWRDSVGAPVGSRVGDFVSFVDFAPTVLNLAGVEVPAAMDGRAFLGKSLSSERRDEAIGYADRFDEKYDLVRTLRRGRFKYVRSYWPFTVDGLQNNYRYRMRAYREWRKLYRAGKLDPVQRQFFEPRRAEALFDLESDPHETRDLSEDPAHRPILASMRTRLAEFVTGWPDLSFFPESVLVAEAFDDPAGFARARKAAIARLVEIADLSLVPFEDARAALESAIASEDPWQRYWALISCASHGRAATALAQSIGRLAASETEPLVRMRAGECLALIGAVADGVEPITAALYATESPLEALLIFNTVALLEDVDPETKAFSIEAGRLAREVREHRDVKRRLEYLGLTR